MAEEWERYAQPIAFKNPSGDQQVPEVDASGDIKISAIGAVTASPVTNTLLDRLKALLTGIVLATGSAIIGKVRLVTSGGTEVTDNTNGTVKTARGKATILNSGLKTADGLIKGSPGEVYWLTVSDTSAAVIQLNDSTNDGGTDLWGITIPDNGYAHMIFDPPIEFATAIFLDVPTGAPDVYIGYK